MTKQTLTLSLIIPVYNEESHLKSCLESIASQSNRPLEVIVVDNNSTDGSIEVAKQYNFVTILSEDKQGVVNARNRGFNAAKGDIIGRIDADTILKEKWVENVIELFKDVSIAAATGPVSYYDMPLQKVGQTIDNLVRSSLVRASDNFPFLFGTNMAIRRSLWQKYKKDFCTDNAMHEDLDMAIHLYKAKQRIIYSKAMIVGMSARRYDDSLSDFYRYISYFKSTFERHNVKSSSVKVAMSAFMIGYFALKPVRLLYDPENDSYSFSQLFIPKVARKHPMD